jgi:uncharacterized protein
MTINQIILKVTSSCNLNCKYCYVFNKGDNSYKLEPVFISDEVIVATLNEIEKHCSLNNISNFYVVFHGGEPLLIGKEFYKNFVALSQKIITSTTIHLALQTNGTLLDKSWCNLLKKLNIHVGISLDGTRSSNMDRVFRKNNEPAYDKIICGLKVLNECVNYSGILSVININESPDIVYNHFKELRINSADFLIPDTNYDFPMLNHLYLGDWLINLFDLWYDDQDSKFGIRSFESIIHLFLGYEISGNEEYGNTYNSVITIKTDGSIEPVDNLKICGDGFTKTDLNILHNTFNDSTKNELIVKYYNAHQDTVLCDKCKSCIIKSVCGGGQLAHRYSSENGFDNSSLYCSQIFKFFVHIQNRLLDDLPIEIIKRNKLIKLSLSDSNNK